MNATVSIVQLSLLEYDAILTAFVKAYMEQMIAVSEGTEGPIRELRQFKLDFMRSAYEKLCNPSISSEHK